MYLPATPDDLATREEYPNYHTLADSELGRYFALPQNRGKIIFNTDTLGLTAVADVHVIYGYENRLYVQGMTDSSIEALMADRKRVLSPSVGVEETLEILRRFNSDFVTAHVTEKEKFDRHPDVFRKVGEYPRLYQIIYEIRY